MTEQENYIERIRKRISTECPENGFIFLKTIDAKDLLAMKHHLKQKHIDQYTYAWTGIDGRPHQLSLTVGIISKELRRRIDAAE